MAAPKKSRKSPRAQVSLVARYRSPTAFEFVQEECFDLSLGGMFIRSPAPAPAGTLIKLECDVNGTAGKIRGVARVVWLREHSTDTQPAGMGVKFVKLDPGARETIADVLEQLGAAPDERDTVRPPAPTSVPTSAPAPSSVPAAARTSAPVPSSVPASARTSAPAGAAIAYEASPQPTSTLPGLGGGASSENAPALGGGASLRPAGAKSGAGSSRVDGPVSAPAPSAHASAPEAPKHRSSPRPPAPSAKGAPIDLPMAAAVAASVARAPSGKPERANVRVTPAARTARTGGSDARQAATLPPSGAGSHSFVFGALALAGAVTLFIVFSSQQSLGPSVAAPQPAAVASQIAAPVAVAAPAAAAAPAPAAQVEPPAKYVLDIATTPTGARVTAGDRVVVTPGQLDLGQLDEPVQLTAESDGFEPAVATIDRVGFMREDGAMHRRIELNLSAKAPEPAPAPAPEVVAAAAEPAPRPTPAPARVPRSAPAEAPTAEHSHRAHGAQPKPTADAPAKPSPAVAELPVVAITRAAEPGAVPAPSPAPAAVTPTAAAAPTPVAISTPVPAATPVARPVLAATPVAAAPEATAAAQPAQAELRPATPLETATACLTRGDNPCVIRALEGKAKSPRELELLIETYRATGDQRKAEASMKVYVDNYPSERRANNYRSVLERQ